MIHHPVVIGIKLIFLVVIGVVLLVLRGVLTPEQFRVALITGGVVFVLGTLVLWVFAFRTLANPDSKLGKSMILHPHERTDDDASLPSRLEFMVGARGVTVSPLRPAGTAVFGEERISVVTEGGYIEAGSQVEIVSAKGARVVVRPTHAGHL